MLYSFHIKYETSAVLIIKIYSSLLKTSKKKNLLQLFTCQLEILFEKVFTKKNERRGEEIDNTQDTYLA